MIICITGTPGTGKTALASTLSEALGYPVLDVKKFILEKGLSEGYDKEKKCEIVDTKKLVCAIQKEIKKVKKEHDPLGVIVESHLSHYLPSSLVDMCIVTTCDLKVLKKRLEERNYSEEKVRENLDAEILCVCEQEAREAGHRVIVIPATKSIKKDRLSKLLGEIDESTS